LLDFLSRTGSRKVNRKVAENLIKCGALDFTGEPRASLYASIDALMGTAEGTQRDRLAGQTSMFDVFKDKAQVSATYGLPRIPEWSEKEKLIHEKESLGVYLSSHPLEPYRERLALVTTDTTETVKERRSGDMVVLGGIASEIKETNTKKGERMAFIRLSDLDGSIEVIVFSDLYRKSREMIVSEGPIVVKGRLDADADDEKPKLVAEEIALFKEAKDIKDSRKMKEGRKAHIRVRTEDVGEKDFADLRQALKDSPGATPVFLHLVYPGGREVVIGLSEELKMGVSKEAVESIKKTLPGAEVSFS
ncbi:MAG: hypothetical protein HY880_03730, partial [Deltaproteobacteria bacterium]|nr:hypothetical protein [Deltaproteobacteria bacterium]